MATPISASRLRSRSSNDQGRFGRLFPTLPPFAADTKLIQDALAELGAQGGPMDAGDDLSNPVTLITDPAKSVNNPDNSTITAGFTFLAQFLDHDMTFDPTSSLARRQDPEAIRNFRIPALDLDSVYGGGPVASPHLYDRSVDGGQTTLLTEEIPGSAAVSVDGSDPAGSAPQPPEHRPGRRPAQRREPDRRPAPARVPALPQPGGGGRQDRAGSPGYTSQELFAEAQRVMRWHYQWLVLHEFLSVTVGLATADDVLTNGPDTSAGATTPSSRSSSRWPLPLRPLPGPSQLPGQLRDQRR